MTDMAHIYKKNESEKKANARDLILETAGRIFSRFGFKKTTMDEIARALHRAKSSIYYYFKSKEEIFKSIVETESRLMREEIQREIEKKSNPDDKLKAYVIARIRTLNRLANYYSALKDDYLENYSFIEEIREEHLRNEIQAIKRILAEGVKKGLFAVANLKKTAIAILTALKGLESHIILESKHHEIEPIIDNLLFILFNGIRKRSLSTK
jgi:AcrR family transcriptional regulator